MLVVGTGNNTGVNMDSKALNPAPVQTPGIQSLAPLRRLQENESSFFALLDWQGVHVLQGTGVSNLNCCLFLPQPCPRSWAEFGTLLPCAVQNVSKETTAQMNKTETVRKRKESRRRGNHLNGMRELLRKPQVLTPHLSSSQSYTDFATLPSSFLCPERCLNPEVTAKLLQVLVKAFLLYSARAHSNENGTESPSQHTFDMSTDVNSGICEKKLGTLALFL